MNGLRKAIVLATAEQQLALGANFVVAVLSARLMSPQEIGVAVVGMAIVGLVTALREYATASFLIKYADISPTQMHGALTGIICTNAILSAGLALSAPIFGLLYADARMVSYLQVAAMGVMAEAFALPVIAVLRREMAIDKAATVGIVGTTVLATVTIGLSASGCGHMSFAWGFLAGTSASAVTAASIRPQFWLFRPSFCCWRELFAFGGFNGTNSLLRQVYDSVPFMILGQVLSFETAAYFHRALMLSQLPGKLLLNGVEALMLPALAAQARRSPQAIKEPFLRTVECVSAVYWPALLVLVILAEPIVRILYGQAWVPVTPLLQIMALAALSVFLGKLDASVLVAAGGERDMMMRGLIVFPLGAAISTISAMFGVFALAWSYWMAYPIQLATSIYYLRRHLAFSLRELGSALLNSARVAVLSSVGPLIIATANGGREMPIAATCAAGVLAVGGWVFGLRLTGHILFEETTRSEAPTARSKAT
jgi:O-antigen/teichoic acid export membrane protein